jgi:hypothetical protein
MKANAPEKIYLLHDDRYVDDLSIIWFEAPYATGSIEYTRTDAFIEKACDAYCAICDTKECGDTGECEWVKKFRKRLIK